MRNVDTIIAVITLIALFVYDFEFLQLKNAANNGDRF